MDKVKNKLDRPQILAIMLVLALMINALIHFTHPAYRYYKEEIQSLTTKLDTRYETYEKNIATNIIPAIINISSNNMQMVQSYIQTLDLTKQDQLAKSNVIKNDREQNIQLPVIIGHIFSFDGKRGLWTDGIAYYIGDDYDGKLITNIGKSNLYTSDGVYNVKRPQEKIKDIAKND